MFVVLTVCLVLGHTGRSPKGSGSCVFGNSESFSFLVRVIVLFLKILNVARENENDREKENDGLARRMSDFPLARGGVAPFGARCL